MAGAEKTMIVEEPGNAETGRKKRMNLRIGGPGILVGALAVAFVVGAAIRIRRYRSLNKARKRFKCSSTGDSNGGLRSILQAAEDYPRYCGDGTSETILNGTLEENVLEEGSRLQQDNMKNDLSKDEIQIRKIGEDEGDAASDTDHGVLMTANETNEANAEYVVVEKCDEGSQGTEDSSTESNAEVVWPVEMEEWQLEIKDMKISYKENGIACPNETERRIPVKIKLRVWTWTTLMLLLLLLLSLTNQKSYVSSSC